MPRQRVVNTKTAERAGTPKPKHKVGTKASGIEIARRERTMGELVLWSSNKATRYAVMQREFPGITEATIDKMFVRANKQLEEDVVDLARNETAKQKRRVLALSQAAKAKGNFSAAIQGERLYAEIAGTLAKVTIRHEHAVTATFEMAFKQAASQLGESQIEALLNGETVPLGAAAGSRVIDVVPLDGDQLDS